VVPSPIPLAERGRLHSIRGDLNRLVGRHPPQARCSPPHRPRPSTPRRVVVARRVHRCRVVWSWLVAASWLGDVPCVAEPVTSGVTDLLVVLPVVKRLAFPGILFGPVDADDDAQWFLRGGCVRRRPERRPVVGAGADTLALSRFRVVDLDVEGHTVRSGQNLPQVTGLPVLDRTRRIGSLRRRGRHSEDDRGHYNDMRLDHGCVSR
jgi:hypothetical protein